MWITVGKSGGKNCWCSFWLLLMTSLTWFIRVVTKNFNQKILTKRYSECPPTQTPKQKLKSGFLMLSSKQIGLNLVSYVMIFEALQRELFGMNFHSLSSEILKILEFNLIILNMSPTHFVYNIRHERRRDSVIKTMSPTLWSCTSL